MTPEPIVNLAVKSGSTSRQGEPVVIGVPLPCGGMTDARTIRLFDKDSAPVPCDVSIMDRWGDCSVRWALLAFQAHTQTKKEAFRFQIVPKGEQQEVLNCGKDIEIEKLNGGYRINTGPAVFTIAPGLSWPIKQVESATGGKWLNEQNSGLFFKMADKSAPVCRIDNIDIETRGNCRVVLMAQGKVQLPGEKRIEVEWRLEFFSGSPVVVLHATLRNPHRAVHPGGFWELGDPGSLLIKEAVFNLETILSNNVKTCFSPEPEKEKVEVAMPFEFYQDSSGGENYLSHNHINRNGEIPIKFQGYRSADSAFSGSRANPVIFRETSSGSVALAMRQFWQNFPKAIDATETGFSLGLFPRQWNDLHELQGGEQKTHTFAIAFGTDSITNQPLDWFRNPLIPTLNPEWAAYTKAVPYLAPSVSSENDQYENLVNSAIDGPESFERKREIVDEYGWRNFGDIYADHESIFIEEYDNSEPMTSHYNNQYDVIAGFCYQWLRSGDNRWWALFNELAGHVTDIDIYHTSEDKFAYNNGLFWHTIHYIDAGRSTHRSYPHIGKSNGGGPANEQLYTTGLMLHYFLTGNIQSRDAAVNFGQYVIDIDDGTKTIFKWLSRSYTGLASVSRSAEYHGPGRGSGNALNALIDAHRLTGSRRFIEKAEQLVLRVCHPDQNIEELNLLDSENRWFYTMFLQSLGKYLDYKNELKERDVMYLYVRSVLLKFSDWMSANEYPFLEKPEILEYPTETWAAQDMRKHEIFKFAALYAADTNKRDKYLERAVFFYNQTVKRLSGMATRGLCRPVVLLLSFGWMDITGFTRDNDITNNTVSFPRFRRFKPQKALAFRNVKILLAAGVLALILIIFLILN